MAVIKNGKVKVEKGDTLSAIAKKADTTVAAIAKANGIKNVNLINPGQVFTLPSKTASTGGQQGSGKSGVTASTGTIWVATDGSEFTTEEAFRAHQDTLDATAKAEKDRIAAEKLLTEQRNAAATPPPTTTPTGNINTSTTPVAPVTPAAPVVPAEDTEDTTPTLTETQENAISVMQSRFKQYGLETLAAKIRELAISGATDATITLQLQETPEYQQRFKANTARIKAGLQVLTPAEYLSVEDTYRQVLRSYGLKQFDTDEYVSQFISNDVSPTELSNRVQLAVQRVQNADPAVSKTLRDYYGIGQADLVAYTLDPATQFQKIERQVQAAEIGTAARIQGLETGVGVAEQLAAQGVTLAEAQKGYATIADILPTAEKLSGIYGKTMDTYGQSQAEQEVFNTLASAQRARQKLTAREVAQFSGTSGVSKTSLSSGGGQI